MDGLWRGLLFGTPSANGWLASKALEQVSPFMHARGRPQFGMVSLHGMDHTAHLCDRRICFFGYTQRGR